MALTGTDPGGWYVVTLSVSIIFGGNHLVVEVTDAAGASLGIAYADVPDYDEAGTYGVATNGSAASFGAFRMRGVV